MIHMLLQLNYCWGRRNSAMLIQWKGMPKGFDRIMSGLVTKVFEPLGLTSCLENVNELDNSSRLRFYFLFILLYFFCVCGLSPTSLLSQLASSRLHSKQTESWTTNTTVPCSEKKSISSERFMRIPLGDRLCPCHSSSTWWLVLAGRRQAPWFLPSITAGDWLLGVVRNLRVPDGRTWSSGGHTLWIILIGLTWLFRATCELRKMWYNVHKTGLRLTFHYWPRKYIVEYTCPPAPTSLWRITNILSGV